MQCGGVRFERKAGRQPPAFDGVEKDIYGGRVGDVVVGHASHPPRAERSVLAQVLARDKPDYHYIITSVKKGRSLSKPVILNISWRKILNCDLLPRLKAGASSGLHRMSDHG